MKKRQRKSCQQRRNKPTGKERSVALPLAVLDPKTGRVKYSAKWVCPECGARPFKGEVLHTRRCRMDPSSARLYRAIDAILYECGIALVDIQRVVIHDERTVTGGKHKRAPRKQGR